MADAALQDDAEASHPSRTRTAARGVGRSERGCMPTFSYFSFNLSLCFKLYVGSVVSLPMVYYINVLLKEVLRREIQGLKV